MIFSKIKALIDKEKNLQAPVEMEELSDGEAINVVGGNSGNGNTIVVWPKSLAAVNNGSGNGIVVWPKS